MIKKVLAIAGVLTVGLASVLSEPTYGLVVAPSTWATSIVIDPQLRDTNGAPFPPSSAAFDDWNSIPLAVADPADNPSPLNIIDIADVKIANDANLVYIYASGHKMRTNGMYIAFDTDQNVATGFNIFGLNLVGSELGYVNDFVFDQRTAGVFNDNKPDPGGSCCTGGPLDLNNGGAALYPGWDVEFGQREWGIPLDAMWSVNQPFGPTIPNPTFNFILWTDQALSDVTEVIQYTLATPPGLLGDYNNNGTVDAADYVLWRKGGPLQNEGVLPRVVNQDDYTYWRSHFGAPSGSGGGSAITAVPEPAAVLLCVAFPALLFIRRSR